MYNASRFHARLANVVASIRPTRPRVGYINRPLGLDVAAPRFSWALQTSGRAQEQDTYQIRVFDGASKSVWDSGVVESNASQNVPYAGSTLLADSSYRWRLDVTAGNPGSNGLPVGTTANSTFTTGLLTEADWKGAQWIGLPNKGSGVQLRTEFEVPAGRSVRRAFPYRVGLGYYTPYLDGARVPTHELDPLPPFRKRVFYDTFIYRR